MNSDLAFLQHISDNIENIRKFTNAGRSDFLAKLETQYAVIRALEIIGEAVKRLSSELCARHPDIPWRNVAGLRDVLIHNYFGVDLDRVWNVVDKHLEPLRQAVDFELAQLTKAR